MNLKYTPVVLIPLFILCIVVGYGMLAVSKNGVDGLKSTQVGLNILPGDNQPAAIARDGPRDGRTRNLDHLRGDVVSVVGL